MESANQLYAYSMIYVLLDFLQPTQNVFFSSKLSIALPLPVISWRQPSDFMGCLFYFFQFCYVARNVFVLAQWCRNKGKDFFHFLYEFVHFVFMFKPPFFLFLNLLQLLADLSGSHVALISFFLIFFSWLSITLPFQFFASVAKSALFYALNLFFFYFLFFQFSFGAFSIPFPSIFQIIYGLVSLGLVLAFIDLYILFEVRLVEKLFFPYFRSWKVQFFLWCEGKAVLLL